MDDTEVPVRTNRDVFRETPYPICEWNLVADRIAMLDDEFHGMAIIRVGDAQRGNTYRICLDCATSEAMRKRPKLGPIPWRKGAP